MREPCAHRRARHVHVRAAAEELSCARSHEPAHSHIVTVGCGVLLLERAQAATGQHRACPGIMHYRVSDCVGNAHKMVCTRARFLEFRTVRDSVLETAVSGQSVGFEYQLRNCTASELVSKN